MTCTKVKSYGTEAHHLQSPERDKRLYRFQELDKVSHLRAISVKVFHLLHIHH
jgi:hypothetical protein